MRRTDETKSRDGFLPQSQLVDDRNRQRVVAAVLAALTAVGAYVHLPLPFVPVTLQTLFVYLSGLLLIPTYAVLAQAAYLATGLAGAPVFAGGRGGLAVVYSPTFGYLVCFPLAAWVVSVLAKNGGRSAEVTALVAGGGVILIVGSLYLWANMRWIVGSPMGLREALWVGAIVFVPAELLKMTASWFVSARVLRAARSLN